MTDYNYDAEDAELRAIEDSVFEEDDCIVNLTPHEVKFVDGNSVWSIPSAGVARVETLVEKARELPVSGIPVVRATKGEVVNLPNPSKGTIYIVSAMVREAVPHRTDVFSPHGLVRDDAGNVVGCEALVGN